MTFEQTIQTFVSRHGLLRRDGFYVVALSGGADSVALLRVLHGLGYHVAAAHCNFGLRGEESARDEHFCVSLCERMQVPLHRAHFDTRLYAEVHHVSIEMAARDLRYRYFEQLRCDIGADGICVAHHRDDQVETVLLNLIRGTGLAGLQGMKPRNGHVLRPLLGVSRQKVLVYLETLRQPYVTDSTNMETDAMRNRLRINVIPLLEEINPGVRKNIVRMTENLAEVSKMVETATQAIVADMGDEQTGYSMVALRQAVSPSYVLWRMLQPLGFNRTQVMEILSSDRNGAQWTSSEWVAVTERGRLYIYARSAWEMTMPTVRMPEPGVYVTSVAPKRDDDGSGAVYEMRLRLTVSEVGEGFKIGAESHRAYLDADKVVWPLTLRPVVSADRFVPFGMIGSKLVSDFLTDRKVSLLERRCQTVLEDAVGRIVWVVGLRVDDRFAIRRDTTRCALIVDAEVGEK